MRFTTRVALVFSLVTLSGCIAVLPVSEYVPTTTDGVIHKSNCIGMHSVRYDFDLVRMYASVRGRGADGKSSDAPQLILSLSLTEKQTARFLTSTIRITPLDSTPEESRTLPTWQRNESRLVKPNRRQLESIIVETVGGAEAIVGGTPNDGDRAQFPIRPSYKLFKMYIPLSATDAAGYRISLPAIEINGKAHTIAPLEYQKQRRIEFMVPLNC